MDKLEILASTLSTLSGSPAVFAYEKPKDEDECIIYKQISSVPVRSHSGSMLEKTRIQLDVYGVTLAESRALAQLVKSELDCNTDDFVVSYLTNDFTVRDGESNLFRTILQFFIW